MSLILVDGLKDRPGTGGPKFPNGLHLPAGIGITGDGHINMAGVCTFSGNVTIGGTLTYEDVTNIDSVGVVTARSGVNVSGGEFKVGTAITVGSAGVSTFSGNVNLNGVSSFAGGVGIADSIFHSGDTNTAIRFPSADTVTVETSGSERARIDSSGRLLLGTATANSSDRFTIVDPGNAFISLRSDAEADGNSQIIDFAVGTGDRSSSNLVSSITSAIPTGAAAGGTLKGHLAFSTNSGDSLSERLRLDSSGDLLLGTTTSAGKLTVDSGTSNTCATFQSSDAGAGINVKDNSARSSIEQNGVSLKISSDTGAEHANSDIRFQVDSSTKALIDSSGRLLLGHTSSITTYGVQDRLQVSGTDYATSGIAIRRDSADAGGGNIIFGKSRGSQGGVTVVQSGDSLGELVFCGADGTDVTSYAGTINCSVDGTPGSNDLPGRLTFSTASDGAAGVTERMRLDSAGRVLINATGNTNAHTQADDLVVGNTSHGHDTGVTIVSNTSYNGWLAFSDGTSASDQRKGAIVYHHPSDIMYFRNAGNTTRLQINSVGITSVQGQDDQDNFIVNCSGTEFAVHTDTSDGEISLRAQDQVGSTNAKYMTFFTQESGSAASERMRISSTGEWMVATTSSNPDTGTGSGMAYSSSKFRLSRSGNPCGAFNRANTTGTIIELKYNGTERGSIQTDGTVIAFNTGSDYRLKENEVAITDGITKVKQLKPYRFNFKETPNKLDDGFFAHEVQTIVPGAVSGTKDAVHSSDDDENNIKAGDVDPQQLDYAKLTPLLTAALQEEIAEIETLKAKVAALEAN